MSHLNLPNFLIIGAPKSGTTSLFQYLRLHPDIFMSSLKEPNFFSLQGQSINYQGPGDQRGNRCRITNLNDYQNLFKSATHHLARGEASTVYLYSEHAAANIAQHNPDMKMIAILRNPVDLAYSAFLHMQREGREPCMTFEQALAEEDNRIRQNWAPLWHLTAQGFYGKQLKQYYSHFSKQQIKVFPYEQWQQKPQETLQDILQFLEVRHDVSLDTSQRFNESGQPKRLWLHHLLTKNNLLKQMLKPILPKKFRRNMMVSLTKKNLAPSKVPPMQQATRMMLQDRFHDDIILLSEITENPSFKQWLNHE